MKPTSQNLNQAQTHSKRGGPGALTERDAIIRFYGKRGLNRANLGGMMTVKSEQHPRGGLSFKDFEPGAFVKHRLTQGNNMLFSNMTLHQHPLHIQAYLRATETAWADL